MQTYRLSQLNEYLRRVIALNFSESFWIRAEIHHLQVNRGHCYLDLIEKSSDGEDIVAQLQGVIWNNTLSLLKSRYNQSWEQILQEGNEVSLKARPDFHIRYGLKLIVEDLDPAYTLGQLELRRMETLNQLRQEGLLDANRKRPLPFPAQRIAVISSPKAAGYADFSSQLRDNDFGFRFAWELFPAAMQGQMAESEILASLEAISRRQEAFDCIVLLRGGGSRSDLQVFNNLELCRALAKAPLPVLTGIGHETDESIADIVAHTALKTPTALAEFLVRNCLQAATRATELGSGIQNALGRQVQRQRTYVNQLSSGLASACRQTLRLQVQQMTYLEQGIPARLRQFLATRKNQLQHLGELLDHNRPQRILEKGFSLTLSRGKVLRESAGLQEGDALETRLARGTVFSTVNRLHSNQ